MVLGKGTAWKTAQSWALVFDMAHPEMGGVQQATALNASEVAGQAVEAASKE